MRQLTIIKVILKYIAVFAVSLVVVGILAFIFRDFLALKYANFFYFEKYPREFNKEDFTRFSRNFAQNLAQNQVDSANQSKTQNLAHKNNLDSAIFAESQNLPTFSRESRNLAKNSSQILQDSQNLHQILRPNSAILVLGGRIQSRLFHAIALYCYGISDLVLITNPANYIYNDFGGAIQSEVAQMKGALGFVRIRYKSVPSKNPLGAQSTRDEALDVVDFLRENPLDEIFIVTSEFHSKRAYIVFRDTFAKANITTKIYLLPTPNRIFNRTNWHKSELGLASYLLEAPKLLLYYTNGGELKGIKAH